MYTIDSNHIDRERDQREKEREGKMKVELKKLERKGFKRKGGEFKERKGSIRFGVISDDFGESIVKWWNGEWKIVRSRMDSKVSASLGYCHMRDALENSREEKVEEKFSDFKKFSERMVRIVGVDEFLKIVKWIQG